VQVEIGLLAERQQALARIAEAKEAQARVALVRVEEVRRGLGEGMGRGVVERRMEERREDG
jgi:sirohydrochlorin ferrochelatase